MCWITALNWLMDTSASFFFFFFYKCIFFNAIDVPPKYWVGVGSFEME